MPDTLYPLSALALETGIPAAELAHRYAAVTLVDAIGRACLDQADAARLIREHRDQLAARAQREAASRQAHRERLAQLPNPQARVRALQARHAELRDRGMLGDDATALEACLVSSGTDMDRQERKGRILDDLMRQERDPDRAGGHIAGATVPRLNRKD